MAKQIFDITTLYNELRKKNKINLFLNLYTSEQQEILKNFVIRKLIDKWNDHFENKVLLTTECEYESKSTCDYCVFCLMNKYDFIKKRTIYRTIYGLMIQHYAYICSNLTGTLPSEYKEKQTDEVVRIQFPHASFLVNHSTKIAFDNQFQSSEKHVRYLEMFDPCKRKFFYMRVQLEL